MDSPWDDGIKNTRHMPNRLSKAEKAAQIARILSDLYPEPAIPLKHSDPYTLLVAVVLSAQCTDVRVNQVAPILFARANNPADMVKLSVDEIQTIIRPVALRRASPRQFMTCLTSFSTNMAVRFPSPSMPWRPYQA